jgi:hypothetical protein
MNIKILEFPCQKEKNLIGYNDLLNRIVGEYYDLVSIEKPSDADLQRIGQILDLAIYDPELSNLINEVDEHFYNQIFLSDEYLTKKRLSNNKNQLCTLPNLRSKYDDDLQEIIINITNIGKKNTASDKLVFLLFLKKQSKLKSPKSWILIETIRKIKLLVKFTFD